jgi:hypothetical protein
MDLSAYPTELLEAMLPKIKEELSSRRRKEKASRRSAFAARLQPIDTSSRESADKSVFLNNSRNLLSVRNHDKPLQERAKYLEDLISQNWSHLYPREYDQGNFYVYAHVDPRKRIFVSSNKCGGNYKGQPFYIGKGVGGRAFDLKRNQGHGKLISQILRDGYSEEDIVHIAFSGISEPLAYELESKLIYFFKTIYEDEKFGYLVNLDVGKRPEFIGIMQKYIIKRNLKGE